MMFGDDTHDYDYACKSCGHGYDAEVGMGSFTCEQCGGPLNGTPKPESTISMNEIGNRLRSAVRSAEYELKHAQWELEEFEKGYYPPRPETFPL